MSSPKYLVVTNYWSYDEPTGGPCESGIFGAANSPVGSGGGDVGMGDTGRNWQNEPILVT